MLTRLVVTSAISVLSMSASALTLIGEKEILNLSASSNPSPVIMGRICQITQQKIFLGLSEDKVLAALSRAQCTETAVDPAQLNQYVKKFNDKLKFQLLSAGVVAYVTDKIWNGLRNGSLTTDQLAEPGFTFDSIPGVDDLGDFKVRISAKSGGRQVQLSKDEIRSAYIELVKELKMDLRFNDFFVAAASNRVEQATAGELSELKAALGLGR